MANADLALAAVRFNAVTAIVVRDSASEIACAAVVDAVSLASSELATLVQLADFSLSGTGCPAIDFVATTVLDGAALGAFAFAGPFQRVIASTTSYANPSVLRHRLPSIADFGGGALDVQRTVNRPSADMEPTAGSELDATLFAGSARRARF